MLIKSISLGFLTVVFLYGAFQLALTIGSTILAQLKEFEGRFSLFALGASCYVAAAVGAILTVAAQFSPEFNFLAFENTPFSPLFLMWFFASGLAFAAYALLRKRLEVAVLHKRRLGTPERHSITSTPYAFDEVAEGPIALSREGAPVEIESTRIRTLPRIFDLPAMTKLSEHMPFRNKLDFAKMAINQVYHLDVVENDLALPTLPREFDGLKIAHLTDFHFTPDMSEDYYHYCFDLAMEWEPDLIALTGDFVSKPEHFGYGMGWLESLRAPLGVWASRGNHDYWKRDDEIAAMLKDMGIETLNNRAVALKRDGTCIALAGLEHPWLPLERGADIPLPATAACSILMSHTPDNFHWAVRRNYSLVLAGHTHGGQVQLPVIGPPLVASRFGKRYAEGLFEKRGTYMYVSRGLGCSVPLRINCAPEITLFHLTCGISAGIATA